MRVARESGVAAFGASAASVTSLIAEIEHGIHHAGHRNRRAAERTETSRGRGPCAERAAGLRLEPGDAFVDLGFEAARAPAARGEKRLQAAVVTTKAGGTLEAERLHARDRPGLAADQIAAGRPVAVEAEGPLSEGDRHRRIVYSLRSRRIRRSRSSCSSNQTV